MADSSSPAKPYKNAAVRPPTMEELTDLAKQFGLQCIEKDLADIKGHIDGILTSYQRLDEMVAPTLPVKYPRVPGRRPETEENKYNAWFWKCDIAGASEGLLKGKRVAIKDSICVSGVPMSNGSKIMEEFVPDIDATVVTRVLDAGGRVVGKTSCEHLCYSGSSWTNDFGPVLNPNDTTRSSGGSSGGSAVVVFTGDADMAIGGDQGGSIRIPSSWCGIVGLKPTWGLVPYTGAVPIEITCDHLGPMAKTVADCALLLEVIAGFDDGNDCRQPRDLQVPKYSQMLTGDISGKKIGLVKEAFDGCDEGVQKVVRDAANMFTQAGAVVEEFSLPAHNDAVDVWGVICTEGGYDCLFKGNGAGYQNKGYYSTAIIEKLRSGYKTNPDNLSDVMKLVLLFGEYISQKYGNKFYAKAQNLCKKITEEYNTVLEKYDVLVMPTLPYTAPPLPSTESSVKERLVNSLGMVKNTAPFDCTGLPALTINAGFCDKLPVGMTIVGKSFDEMSVLQAARAYEKLRDGEE